MKSLMASYRADVWGSMTECCTSRHSTVESSAFMTDMFVVVNAKLGIGILKKIIDVDVESHVSRGKSVL